MGGGEGGGRQVSRLSEVDFVLLGYFLARGSWDRCGL